MQWGVSCERDHGEKMGSPIEACSEERPLGATATARYINRQYGGGRILSARSLPGVSLLAQPPVAEATQAVAAQSVPPTHGTPNVIYDWAARIHAKKFELGRGYAILIFLGDVPDDVQTCARRAPPRRP